MPTPGLSTLLCEGRDDLAAVRGLLKERGATRRPEEPRRASRPGASAPEHWLHGAATLIVQGVGGKEKLAEVALDFAQGTAAEHPGRIVVCFDPDRDPASSEFDFLVNAVGRAGRSSAPERSGDEWKIRVNDREVLLIPAPWRSPTSAPFDHLPDHHCLERIFISALSHSSVAADLKHWTEASTTALTSLVSDHGWKRAFRIWSAAVDPAESFVDRLLQREDTKLACMRLLRETPVHAALEAAIRS